MKSFPDKLILRALDPEEIRSRGCDVALYEIVERFRCVSSFGEIEVPAGFITDLASIPRAALWYMKDDDPGILMPSVRHDRRYKEGLLTRQQADAELREGMAECGARRDQQFAVYAAVRLGGGSHWNP